MNVNDRSSKIEISTGMMLPRWASVAALYCLTKSMMFTPCGPRAVPTGAATPAPPVGTALGPHGVNIMDFVRQYNAATEAQRGNIIPVEISIFEDRSFTFITKTPPAPELIKNCLLYTSDAADDLLCVDLGGRR